MYSSLSPGAIGVTARNLDEALEAARIGGFGGVEFNISEIADLVASEGVAATRARFDEAGIKPGGWGVPVDWRGTEEPWLDGLKSLPRLAAAAAAIDAPRCMTYILPGSDVLDYTANYQFHVARFQPIATILADNGCSLGLEFIGPKTLRDSFVHPFVHTLHGMLTMGQEIGTDVGLLLDCWHWHTSGGSLADLQALTPQQVVYVHVNDAPAGVANDDQVDNVRCLPGETGVIDIQGFLDALRGIGYDGPVCPEPFKKGLADLPSDEERLKVVGAAMKKIMG